MEKLKTLIWDDWAAVPVDDLRISSMEIGGMLSGLPSRSESKYRIFCSSRLFVFRRLKKIWDCSEWSPYGDFSPGLVFPRGMKGRVSLKLDTQTARDLLSRFGRVNRANQDSWNWLRGVFGSCGSLFIPRTGYYLVFRLPASSEDQLESSLGKVLKLQKIPFRRRFRYGFKEIAVREQSAIVCILSNMRLFKTSLILEERAVLRSMRDRANKIVNCDSSNIRKTIETSERQIRIARFLIENGCMDLLPDPLREVVEARVENPTASLRELGQLLLRPVSKSTIEYRWRKIERMTDIMGE